MKNLTVTRSNLAHRARQIGAGLAASAFAFAAQAGELADAVTGELATAKAEIMLIGAAVLTVAGVILLIRSGKKAAN